MSFDVDDGSVIVASSRQTTADLGTGVAVLNLDSRVYFTLEATGHRIWQLLREPVTVRELTAKLVESYDVDAGRCRTELREFLRALASHGLITLCEREK